MAKHILIRTVDDSGEPLPEEEQAAARATAEDLLAQIRAADDPIATFDQLMNENSEDPGLTSYPDGYLAVPGDMLQEFEDASLALGATKEETWFRVSVPAARSGIAAAVVLGVGRALGEAMAVIMVSGNAPNMPSLFESVRFLTTAVASEMSHSSGLQRQALFSIALVLYLFILLINAALNYFLKRDKEGGK